MSRHKLFKSFSCSSPFLRSVERNSEESSRGSASTSTMAPNPDMTPNRKVITQRPHQVHPVETLTKATQNRIEHVGNLPKQTESSAVVAIQDSDSESEEVNFYRQINRKLPYTMEEDEFILKYVLKGQNIYKVSSILLWKRLELMKKNPSRTYQSLKNRFLKNIKPVIFTRFGHLISNKETTKMILSKFPELKKQMIIGETLSRIRIPVRSRSEKASEAATPSAISNIQRDKPEETKSFSPPKTMESLSEPKQPYQAAASTSASPEIKNFYRKVKFIKNSIKVYVNLNHNMPVTNNTAIPLLLHERFTKAKLSVGPYVCPVCKRGSRRSKVDGTSDSETDAESVIPNSLESAKENCMRQSLKSSLASRKKMNPKSDMGSQSLLTYEDDKDEGTRNNVETSQINRIRSPKSNGRESREDVKEDDQEIFRENSQKNISKAVSSSKKSKLGLEKGVDNDIDLIYENAMAGFQKLISADEEKQLLKKCLYKNRDMIGFNFDSEKNLDSYFLESTPDEKTPSLTNCYSTALTTNEGTAEKESLQKDHSPVASHAGARKTTRKKSKKMKS